MDFLAHYGLFLAKTITTVIALLFLAAGLAAILGKNKAKIQGKLTIKHLNEAYNDARETITAATFNKNELKAHKKNLKAEKKQAKSTRKKSSPRLFVLQFQGDIKASAAGALREEVTAILLTAQPDDEVLLRLESPGGMVHAYGLAASQLQRIKEAGIPLTVAIDNVAASGGYMMACVADKIIAAPFAVIGSIGVIAQIPNFHKLLKKKNIDFEQITAGEYKRTLTLLGENTDKGRQKMQADVDDIHSLFKSFIEQHRPQVNIDQVATGEHWQAIRAIELKLVDALKTSDDYLLQARHDRALYEVNYKIKKTLGKRLSQGASTLYQQLLSGHP